MTARVAFALWTRVSLVPSNLTVKVPAAAGAVKVTDCGVPGESVKDAPGDEVIPFGNPVTVTVAGPVNPFTGASETVIGPVVPPT